MKNGITLVEAICLVVGMFVIGSIVYFWYMFTTDNYLAKQEAWKRDVATVINYNLQQGKLLKPGDLDQVKKQ